MVFINKKVREKINSAIDVYNYKTIVGYIFQSIVVIVILIFGFEITSENIKIPFVLSGDAMHHLMIAKSIVINGWWWSIPQLSAPYGLPMVGFPVSGNLDYSLIWTLSNFSSNPALIINVYWLSTFVFSAWACTWSFRHFRIPVIISFLLGTLFAFIPHVFARNTQHLMLVYFLVPIITTLAIEIALGRFEDISKNHKIIFFSACMMVGVSYIYTAFFSCFVLLISFLVYFIQRTKKTNYINLLPIFIILLSVSFNLFPTLSSWHSDRAMKNNLNQKSPADAEIYGLKIRQLITPIYNHPIPLLSRYEEKSRSVGFPLENENNVEKLGTIGTIGFLFLLVTSIFRQNYFKISAEYLQELNVASTLNLSIILLATIGGFGAIFNLIISSDIRTYNRISVFISYLSFFSFALVLHKFNDIAKKSKIKFNLFLSILTLTFIYGVFDQSNFNSMKITRWNAGEKIKEIVPFVNEIEKKLPKNSNIYQLPYVTYPHTPVLNKLGPHEHIVPYIFSSDLNWSWPALSGKAIILNKKLSILSPSSLIRNLQTLGFNGVWIDRFGYKDNGDKLINELIKVVDVSALESKTGRYVFLNLENYNENPPDHEIKNILNE